MVIGCRQRRHIRTMTVSSWLPGSQVGRHRNRPAQVTTADPPGSPGPGQARRAGPPRERLRRRSGGRCTGPSTGLGTPDRAASARRIRSARRSAAAFTCTQSPGIPARSAGTNQRPGVLDIAGRRWPAQPLDPACPGSGCHGVRPERGSSRPAGTGCRRSRDATRRRWSRRRSSRLVLVTAISASTGAITPAATGTARRRMAGRRPGAGAGGQVMVTDSHHPALVMAPAASSRRQCPRDSSTCGGHRPRLSPGRG